MRSFFPPRHCEDDFLAILSEEEKVNPPSLTPLNLEDFSKDQEPLFQKNAKCVEKFCILFSSLLPNACFMSLSSWALKACLEPQAEKPSVVLSFCHLSAPVI